MKLYATVTSERASKGQGGNEFLAIQVDGAKPYGGTILELRLIPDNYGHATVTGVTGSISLLRAIIDISKEDIARQLKERTKGEKQKGEVCTECGETIVNGKCPIETCLYNHSH